MRCDRATFNRYATDKHVSISVYSNPNNQNKNNNMINKLASNALLGHSLEHAQIGFLCRHSTSHLTIHLLTVLSAGAIATWYYPEHFLLIAAWCLALVGLSAIRWLIDNQIKAQKHWLPYQVERMTKQYFVYSLLFGFLWGLTGFIWLLPDVKQLSQFPIIFIAVVATISIPILSLSKKIAGIMLAILLLPLIGSLIMTGKPLLIILALTIVLLGAGIYMASGIMNQLLMRWHDTHASLLEQASQDQITQTYNRRFFEQMFKNEWQRVTRAQEPISLLMVDIDHFKRFNDLNGHEVSDQCLRDVARTLQKVARRTSDVVARYREDEFAVLLPGTDIEDARLLAERIREGVEALEIQFSKDNFQQMVTVSVGVGSCIPNVMRHNAPQNQSTQPKEAPLFPAVLLGCVERALYKAKRGTRNIVVIENCADEAISLAAQHVESLKEKN